MVTGCIGQSCRIHRFLGEHQARWQHDHLRGKHGKAQRCCEETQAHGQIDTSKGIWPNEPPYPLGIQGILSKPSPFVLPAETQTKHRLTLWETMSSPLLHRLVWPTLLPAHGPNQLAPPAPQPPPSLENTELVPSLRQASCTSHLKLLHKG